MYCYIVLYIHNIGYTTYILIYVYMLLYISLYILILHLARFVISIRLEDFACCSSRVLDYFEGDMGGKLLIELQDKQRIETVLIEHQGSRPRSTAARRGFELFLLYQE